MEWSRNLFRKVEFQDNSGLIVNWNVYGYRNITQKFFQFLQIENLNMFLLLNFHEKEGYHCLPPK